MEGGVEGVVFPASSRSSLTPSGSLVGRAGEGGWLGWGCLVEGGGRHSPGFRVILINTPIWPARKVGRGGNWLSWGPSHEHLVSFAVRRTD